MARSPSQANRLAALVADASSLIPLIHRRGYAAACGVSVRGGIGRMSGMGKINEEKPGSEALSAWAPDPVTGYYRPINQNPEIDPVELRNMLLNHKIRRS